MRETAAPAGVDGDILHAIDHVGDRRSDRHLLHRHLPDLLAGVGAVGGESGGDIALEHQIAGGHQHAAATLLLVRRAPHFPLRHRVARREPAARMGVGIFGDLFSFGVVAREARAEAALRGIEAVGRAIGHVGLADRKIDEASQRAEGHRVEVVRSAGAGRDHDRYLAVADRRVLNRPAGLHVHACRPVDRHRGLGSEQFAGLAIEDIEEAVLRRLHQDLADLSVDPEVGEDHLLGGGIVPLLTRGGLVMPGVFAGIDIERDDRGKEQVVAAARAAERLRPGRAVADADIHQVQRGIVGHRIPHRATAAGLPPLAGPGLGGLGHDAVRRRAFGHLGRIARHGVEAPVLLAGLGVVSGDVAAHAHLGAAVADQHLAGVDPRRAGDRVVLRIVDRQHRPHRLAALRVERDQPAVEGGDVDLAVPSGEPARDDVAASHPPELRRHLRIEAPQHLAVRRVIGGDDVPRLHVVEHAADLQRARFHPPLGLDVGVPGEAEPADGLVVDLVQRAEPLLVERAADHRPVDRLGLACSGEHEGEKQDEPVKPLRALPLEGEGWVGVFGAGLDARPFGARSPTPNPSPPGRGIEKTVQHGNSQTAGSWLASAQKPCTWPTTLNGIFTRATGPAATSLVSTRIRSERPASLIELPMPIR